MKKVQKPRGTKDIFGSEALKYQRIEEAARTICQRYRYTEMATPLFEDTNLFRRAVGEDTDVVNKEMYEFQDKGGRDIALRPEGTAGVVRAYLEHNLQAGTAKTFYYSGTMYRYERPGQGRLREFRQFGVEKFGVDTVLDEVEPIRMAVEVFQALGLAIDLRINSIGCTCRQDYINSVRVELEKNKDSLDPADREKLDSGNILRIFDSKEEATLQVIKAVPKIIASICEPCREDYRKLKAFLQELGIAFSEDPGMVRGLDYYSGNIFEIDLQGQEHLGAVCGGGKYPHLVKQLGGQEEAGFGFAIGLDRVAEVVLPPAAEGELYFFIVTAGTGLPLERQALKAAQQLNHQGYVEINAGSASLKSKLRKADKKGADFVLIIGEQELQTDSITVKNMATHATAVVDLHGENRLGGSEVFQKHRKGD